MKYEEIIEEPRFQVKRPAEFLNCPFTEEEQESGSVEETVNLQFAQTTRVGVESNVFFRKCDVGDWKNYLIPQMAKTIEEIVGCQTTRSGFDISIKLFLLKQT